MKKSILYLAAFTFSLPVIFTACKKSDSQVNTDNTTKVTVQTDDQSRVFEETGAISNDVNIVLEASSPSITGREVNTQALICDATVAVDTLSNPKKITITYNGTNCLGNRTRAGVVVVAIAAGVHWKNAGAAISLTYQNLKVTRLSDNKSITLNGTHTITNVSGGLLINLPNLQSITHTIASSSMSITFDDGTQRTWQVARQLVFTYNNGIVISTRGFHTDGANTGIEEWGTTRFGNIFISSITEPLVIRQDCSFRLVSGKIKHETVLATATATFGLNASGAATSCPGTGSYYFKADWTGLNGKTYTIILPY
ncbi:MAG: hypothetical protein ABIN89_09235 [Chitinophagaceae bacterium]